MDIILDLPRQTFENAERLAHRLSLSRDELYARAMLDFCERMEAKADIETAAQIGDRLHDER